MVSSRRLSWKQYAAIVSVMLAVFGITVTDFADKDESISVDPRKDGVITSQTVTSSQLEKHHVSVPGGYSDLQSEISTVTNTTEE